MTPGVPPELSKLIKELTQWPVGDPVDVDLCRKELADCASQMSERAADLARATSEDRHRAFEALDEATGRLCVLRERLAWAEQCAGAEPAILPELAATFQGLRQARTASTVALWPELAGIVKSHVAVLGERLTAAETRLRTLDQDLDAQVDLVRRHSQPLLPVLKSLRQGLSGLAGRLSDFRHRAGKPHRAIGNMAPVVKQHLAEVRQAFLNLQGGLREGQAPIPGMAGLDGSLEELDRALGDWLSKLDGLERTCRDLDGELGTMMTGLSLLEHECDEWKLVTYRTRVESLLGIVDRLTTVERKLRDLAESRGTER